MRGPAAETRLYLSAQDLAGCARGDSHRGAAERAGLGATRSFDDDSGRTARRQGLVCRAGAGWRGGRPLAPHYTHANPEIRASARRALPWRRPYAYSDTRRDGALLLQ